MKTCKHCGNNFSPENKAQLYCTTSCRWAYARKRKHSTPGHYLTVPVICGICGTEFFRTEQTGPNKKYCSDDCSYRAQMLSQKRFHEVNPVAMAAYNERRYKKHGQDTLINRLYKKYSDLPRVCESLDCNEGRVLEAAHKPEHKRNGRHRTMSLYERHMFWMLCPTCHELIDREICTPAELGLT